MNRTQAERLIAEHLKPLFGFALKRCARIQDAEDVAQEIALKAFYALSTRQDVADPVRYLWTIAHHTMANHYRDKSRMHVGPGMMTADEADPLSILLDKEATARLHREIACLSSLQRQIITAYYFHGQKQSDIARAMGLPVGTVKWHLFEAKKELKQHMETSPELQHLTFDPIHFTNFSVSGSIGTEGSPWRLFRSTLVQNIAYACWKTPRTMAEIAQALGVSPVYLEDVLQQLTQQGYLTQQGTRYLCAILLTENTDLLVSLADHMYKEAARLIAPELLKALQDSDIWSDNTFTCLSPAFALWALIPWCIASCPQHDAIAQRDAATLRPDGACNQCSATFSAPGAAKPALQQEMEGQFSGPCWNEHNGLTIWQMDTLWSDHRIGEVYQDAVRTDMTLMRHVINGDPLSAEEYARLAQNGLIHTEGDPQGMFTAILPVWLQGKDIRTRLMNIASNVYNKHRMALEALIQPYADALMADTPPHLQLQRSYTLQDVYHGHWFIAHCLHTLVDMQLLPLPAEEERAALHTIIMTD